MFLVFNTAAFGDVLLCNSLVQNIKNIYPESKVIFIADKNYRDAAFYQKGVDDVVIYDKKGLNKGILGLIKFIRSFPYKNADYSIVTYKNFRNRLISKFLAKKTLHSKNINKNFSMQEVHANILAQITDSEIVNFPIKYEVEGDLPEKFRGFIDKTKKNVVFCGISKNLIKDFPIDLAVELVNRLSSQGYNVILTGAGQKSKTFADELRQNNCEFIDMVNKTTIVELAQLLKTVGLLISVDTGTMHLGYAVGAQTVCTFFEQNTKDYWGPSEKVYKNAKVFQNPTVDEILNALNLPEFNDNL